MRLISCRIENFGKLHGLELDFASDFTAIGKENGWGKSTLAAFLRVMLFGFSGESKRSGLENERKRFAPWQGGAYGGSLTFSVGEKTYIAERSFGEKKINDIFTLRDARTNLPSTDFSENLGEELFGINSESFARTVFLAQNDCVSATTDSINAKIGNITDSQNDLESFAQAEERIKDCLNQLNPRRKTGEIAKLSDAITRLEREIAGQEGLEESLRRYTALEAEENTVLTQLEQERQAVGLLFGKASRAAELRARWQEYQRVREEQKQAESLADEAAGWFPGEIPKAEEIRAGLRLGEAMEQDARQAQLACLSPEEETRLFSVKEEGEERLQERIARAEALVTESRDLESLVHAWESRKKTIAMQEELLHSRPEEDAGEKSSGGIPPLLLVGAVLAVVGAVQSIRQPVPWVFMLVLGLGLMAAQWLRGRQAKPEPQQDDLRRQREQVLAEDRRFVQEAEERLAQFFARQGRPEAVDSPLLSLHQVEEEARQRAQQAGEALLCLRTLTKKQEAAQGAEARAAASAEAYQKHLSAMGFAPRGSYRDQLQEIWQRRYAWEQACGQVREARQRLERLEKDEAIREILSGQSAAASGREVETGQGTRDLPFPDEHLPQPAQLTQRQRELEEQIEQHQRQRKVYESQLGALREKYDARMEQEEELLQKKKLVAGKRLSHRRLQATQKYLTAAKESLTARYMEPLLSSFSAYYGIITGQPADAYRMDANTRLTVVEQGLQRETEYLSRGYQDLIGLCLRLAFVDAMYTEEKPFLILDDPLVNLDLQKEAGAKNLLEALTKDYQVIYFTCREEERNPRWK